MRATALLRGCHRKTGASPELPRVTKRHSPRRQGFRSDPAVRPSKLRAGADTRGRPEDGTGAQPLLRLCEVADYLTVGPKALHPRQPLEGPTARGDTGIKETSPARGARSPRRPERRPWEAGVPPPGACRQRPALHSPVRRPRRGGARAVGSCGAPHASSRTPTSLGRSRRRQLGREPSPRALPRGRGGTARSTHEEGGNSGPTVCRPGRAPLVPSVCGLPAAATAPATAIAAATGAAATTAARPGTRRGLMRSSAGPPPLWASGAAELLPTRGPAPAPAPPPPPAGGLGSRPLPVT